MSRRRRGDYLTMPVLRLPAFNRVNPDAESAKYLGLISVPAS